MAGARGCWAARQASGGGGGARMFGTIMEPPFPLGTSGMAGEAESRRCAMICKASLLGFHEPVASYGDRNPNKLHF